MRTLKGKNYAKIVITKKNRRINHSGWLYFLQSKVTPNDIYEIIAQFIFIFFWYFGAVSGAQIRQMKKAARRTHAQTSIAKAGPPLSVRIGNKNVPAAAPIRLIVIQVPTPLACTLVSNNSVG